MIISLGEIKGKNVSSLIMIISLGEIKGKMSKLLIN